MNKQLPFHVPNILGYGQFAIALGILDCHLSEQIKLWFVGSFIHLVASLNKCILRFDDEFNDNQFMNCPFLDHYIIPSDFFNHTQASLIDFIEEMIYNDTYVGFLCDRFFLPNHSFEYQNYHNCHFALIIGINRDTSEISMVDYYNNTYTISYMPISCIESAYRSEYCKSVQPYEDSLLCIRYRQSTTFPIIYNPDRLLFLLNEYLKGYKDTANNVWYGISANDALSYYVSNHALKYACIQTIYDHKLAQARRIRYLKELNLVEIEKEDELCFDDAVNQSIIIRNSILKHLFLHPSSKNPDVSLLLDKISQYKEYDRMVMEKLYSLIKQ